MCVNGKQVGTHRLTYEWAYLSPPPANFPKLGGGRKGPFQISAELLEIYRNCQYGQYYNALELSPNAQICDPRSMAICGSSSGLIIIMVVMTPLEFIGNTLAIELKL